MALTPSSARKLNRLIDSDGRRESTKNEAITPTPIARVSFDDADTLQLAQPAFSAGEVDAPASMTLGSDAGAVTFANVVDVLAWRSSASVPVFCGVNVLLLAAASASATSILVFVAKFTVAAVAAGFVKRHALGASPQLGPVSADEIARFAKRSQALINSVLQIANSVLTAQDLRLSIITVATLYAFTLLASVMSVGTMVYGAFGLAFGVVPLHRVAHVQIEQLRTFAEREAAALVGALSFKHVLGLTAGALFCWLFVGPWTKFIVSLLLSMTLKLYRDRNKEEVREGLTRIGKKMPRRLSIGAGAVGRLAAHGARMAMDHGKDFFSPARKPAGKRA